MPAEDPFTRGQDQDLSDADQDSADLDQTSADADQGASDIDQVASDRDQKASDLDQADSDAAQASGSPRPNWARTRRTRSQTTLDRDMAARTRSDTGHIRDHTAIQRDQAADARDVAAADRDRLAALLDDELDQIEKTRKQVGNGEYGMSVLLNAANDRKRAAALRTRSAAQRAAAARDRASARADREAAAADRRASAEELAQEGMDHLTATMRRGVGLAAVEREIERTARSGEPMVVVFVDVDGLKAVNDTGGHLAGDGVLQAVATAIQSALRPYDVILRFGGDEFVCSLSGQDLPAVRSRFGEIAGRLRADGGPTISVGYALADADQSIGDLIRRADQEMMATRDG